MQMTGLFVKKLAVLGAFVSTSFALPAQASVITDTTPYYMCFAYTPDGMFFAGGDFNLQRAKKMLSANCGMPRSLSVVLLKTMMKHSHGKTLTYASTSR